MKEKSYVDERRERYPGRGLRMDYENSRSVAIEEFCRGCLQSSSAADCPSRSCPLFPFRPGAGSPKATTRRPGIDVPTREWYEEAIRLQDPDGAKAAAARERFGHGGGEEVELGEEEW